MQHYAKSCLHMALPVALSGLLSLSGCGGGGDDSTTVSSEPGDFVFGSASYTIIENAGSVNLTVSRVGGSSGAVTVDYTTQQNSATDSVDFQPASGTLSFADGVTGQVIPVSIQDDVDSEDTETFDVLLSNPTGGANLGTPSSAIVYIIDDETTPLYDFELLNQGPINGQDNWFEDSTNAYVSLDDTGINGTQVVHPTITTLGGADETALTRVNDSGFSYSAFSTFEGQICFDTTAHDNSLFSLGQDLDGDGMLRTTDGEIGVPFGFFERQFAVLTGNSLTIRAGVANMEVGDDIEDWYRLCLYISFIDNNGDGAGSLFYRNLTDGDTSDIPIPGLQNLNLKLLNAPDYGLWNAMFLQLRVDSIDLIPRVDNLMPNVPLP